MTVYVEILLCENQPCIMVKGGKDRQTEVEIKVSAASFPSFAVRRERKEFTVIDKNIYLLATSICRLFFIFFHFSFQESMKQMASQYENRITPSRVLLF